MEDLVLDLSACQWTSTIYVRSSQRYSPGGGFGPGPGGGFGYGPWKNLLLGPDIRLRGKPYLGQDSGLDLEEDLGLGRLGIWRDR